jgi:ubiquinone/menaquinone biosynthesis C-methylase UbiE
VTDLRAQNDLRFVVGTSENTNLPDNFFDHIYSNGTFHHFSNRDKMIRDIYRKLKPGGDVTIRDSFWSKEEEYCVDAIKVRLPPVDSLLAVMDRNGFRLLARTEFKPYPTFKFGKKL